MTSRRTPLLVHLLGAAAASALAAYGVLRLLAPASPIVAPAAPAAMTREPDAGLAARMFGDVSGAPAAVSLNVQVTGVFAAAKDSSAVIAVDGRPPRAVLLGREVVAGVRLVQVRPDGVTLEHDGVRTQYAVPPLSVAKASSSAPMFRREGDTLTAPSQEPSATGKAPETGRAADASAAGPAAPPAPAVVPQLGSRPGRNFPAPQAPPLPAAPANPSTGG